MSLQLQLHLQQLKPRVLENHLALVAMLLLGGP